MNRLALNFGLFLLMVVLWVSATFFNSTFASIASVFIGSLFLFYSAALFNVLTKEDEKLFPHREVIMVIFLPILNKVQQYFFLIMGILFLFVDLGITAIGCWSMAYVALKQKKIWLKWVEAQHLQEENSNV